VRYNGGRCDAHEQYVVETDPVVTVLERKYAEEGRKLGMELMKHLTPCMRNDTVMKALMKLQAP